tara:strand:- start:2091 stop:3311 length:1221 start_codon:yes stop_codon:yes gene_type:complete
MIIYNLLLFILYPLIIVKILINTLIRKDKFSFFLCRVGLGKYINLENCIWIHASSIGEAKSAIKIIDEIKKKYKETKFALSTSTSSAKNLFKERSDIQHFIIPFDFFFITKRIINKLKPKVLIIIETEIWPNLINSCHSRGIPVFIANARLSKKTLNTNFLMKKIYKNTLSKITKILCKSDRELDNYIELGANNKQLEVCGNIKMVNEIKKINTDRIIERKYVLAASTHKDEERQIITEWLKTNERKILLVIVPRHINRLGDILSDLPLDMIRIAIRSKKDPIRNNTQVYIADTYGELDALIQHCEFVFMGGSLIDHGGQNFIEAAAHGKTIIVGSYMYNFIDETEEFLKANSMIMVKNSQTLKHVFERLLKSKQRRELFGSNALKLLESKKSIMQNYLLQFKDYL